MKPYSGKGSNGQDMQRKAAFTGTVDLYGADWCPHCRAAKQYMTSKGINFRYHKIEEDAAAKAEFERLGGRGIPLVAIGGRKIMSGFDAENFERHLATFR